jgi:hypothetical protein
MKTFTKILILALTLQTANVFAQATDVEVVNFTAVLSNVLNLSITAGADQTATFNTPILYNEGIDVVGATGVTMESTTNWKLSISAPNFTGPGAAIIPINNLGVWCSATGIHTIGGEVVCSNTSLATSRGITVAVQDLITNGTGNAGAAIDNAFDLHWTMGTMEGTMNPASIFAQLANGTIASVGTFTTVVTLTLTAL